MKSMCKTINEIAAAAGISWNTAKSYTGRPGFPKRGKNGWPTEAVLKFAKTAKAQAEKSQTGENPELKAQKLRREIARLDETIAILAVQRRIVERQEGLAADGTYTRPDVVEGLRQIGLAVFFGCRQELEKRCIGMSGTNAIDCKIRGGLIDVLNGAADGIQAQITQRLKEAPFSLSGDELKAASMYLTNRL